MSLHKISLGAPTISALTKADHKCPCPFTFQTSINELYITLLHTLSDTFTQPTKLNL